MASIRYIATTSDKLNSIAVQDGNFIFSQDERAIYLDAAGARTSYQQIITLVNEDQRTKLKDPVQGFYFVKDTVTLWNYDGSMWTQVTISPKTMVFDYKNSFPQEGTEKTLYIDPKAIYQWDSENKEYFEMGSPKWGEFIQE